MKLHPNPKLACVFFLNLLGSTLNQNCVLVSGIFHKSGWPPFPPYANNCIWYDLPIMLLDKHLVLWPSHWSMKARKDCLC